MFQALGSFSGVSVDNLQKAKEFYTNVLSLSVKSEEMGLTFDLPGGGSLYVYEKSDHVPATFTVLNFAVENINDSVDLLVEKGVVFERYDSMPAPQDERGVLRGLAAGMGPDIAWFKDPAGNVLSVLQQSVINK